MGGLHRQAEHGNIVEVIPDLTHDLADPGVAVIAVLPQKLAKIIEHRISVLLDAFLRFSLTAQAMDILPGISAGMPDLSRRSACVAEKTGVGAEVGRKPDQKGS
jgi:hypothetical protein